MKVDPQSTHTVTEVLDKYTAEEDDYAFSKTHVVVMMAQTGDASFISRSQAKRIVARLEKFGRPSSTLRAWMRSLQRLLMRSSGCSLHSIRTPTSNRSI